MFLHVTTRLEGREHDGLLSAKGFTGFPSLAFMDAEGRVVAKHAGARTIANVDKTARDAEAYLMMREKAAQGDIVAQQHVFLKDLSLGRYDYIEGSLKLGTMRSSLSKKMVHAAQRKLATLQYNELSKRLRKQLGTIPREEYSRRFKQLAVDMFKAGPLPEGYSTASILMNVMNDARERGDVAQFEKGLAAYKREFGDNQRYARMVERYESQLETLKSEKK